MKWSRGAGGGGRRDLRKKQDSFIILIPYDCPKRKELKNRESLYAPMGHRTGGKEFTAPPPFLFGGMKAQVHQAAALGAGLVFLLQCHCMVTGDNSCGSAWELNNSFYGFLWKI
jgi:hypothetical protein